MDIATAQSVIRARESSLTERLEAVRSIAESDEVQPADLLECLDLHGICAELAAMKLHLLTGRARDNGVVGVYLDRQSWEDYLRNERTAE